MGITIVLAVLGAVGADAVVDAEWRCGCGRGFGLMVCCDDALLTEVDEDEDEDIDSAF